MRYRFKLKILFTLFLMVSFSGLSLYSVKARNRVQTDKPEGLSTLQKPAASPCSQQRTHRVAKYCFTLTNWGFIGSELERRYESQGGCFNPNPTANVLAPSFEFPCATQLEYLFQGALWIGAIVEGETLVTVGADGWLATNEMYPDFSPDGCIKEKTTRLTTPNCNPTPAEMLDGAISEQDIIAVYYDTLIGSDIDEYDQRAHEPLGIRVTQKSYSWSYDYAEDFVLIDFDIANINESKEIRDLYIGLYIDADVGHMDDGDAYTDDITGFRSTYLSPLWPDTNFYQDTINIGYIADNDGGLSKGRRSREGYPTGVTGVRVVRAPTPNTIFNWWMSQSDVTLDWGPQKTVNWQAYLKKYGDWCNGAKGTPCGDRAKYFVMSNGEHDYDQIYTCVDKQADGWEEPPTTCADMANGYDTRYLFSFGPIELLKPGESKKVTVGYVAGENFHYKDNPIDKPEFYNNLDFSDFANNARWSGWVYDNLGVDTPDPVTGDTDGYKGKCARDTVADTCLFYYEGDGIPDFKGPPPPIPPDLKFETSQGNIKVLWNGKNTEEGKDSFTGTKDFEGYRIYMSYTGLANDWILLSSYDFEDYNMWRLKPKAGGYDTIWLDEKLKPENLIECFGDSLGDTLLSILRKNPDYYNTNNPFVYPGPDTLKYNWYEIKPMDKLFFGLQDWNNDLKGLRDYDSATVAYADSVDNGLIPPSDTIRDVYYNCKFSIPAARPYSFPIWVSVVAFDAGNAKTKLGPLQSSKGVTSKMVFPMDSPEEAHQKGTKVAVVPNPFKISDNYVFPEGRQTGTSSSEMRIFFHYLPTECTLRIFTLDGDLVHETQYKGENGVYSWNLLNRNNQFVVSGIYLYSVESKWGNELGKFVIIK